MTNIKNYILFFPNGHCLFISDSEYVSNSDASDASDDNAGKPRK